MFSMEEIGSEGEGVVGNIAILNNLATSRTIHTLVFKVGLL